MLDGLGVYLGAAFEFVLQGLSALEHSVIKIVNSHHSGGKEGVLITDLALPMLDRINVNNVPNSNYLSKNTVYLHIHNTGRE